MQQITNIHLSSMQWSPKIWVGRQESKESQLGILFILYFICPHIFLSGNGKRNNPSYVCTWPTFSRKSLNFVKYLWNATVM